MSEEEIFSIDLVEAAIAQRNFLKLVDEHPCLYVGQHVQNALKRYEAKFIGGLFSFSSSYLIYTVALETLEVYFERLAFEKRRVKL